MNSANLGPYGDAIVYELIPYIEKKYRGLGAGWARFMYGGSTGGWEAMAAQVFYPDDVQRRLRRLPRSDRLPRLHRRRHLQGQERVLAARARWQEDAAARRMRNYLGHVERDARGDEPPRAGARHEDAARASSGTSGRRSTRRSAPTAIPKRIWDKRTGVIDKEVAEYWQRELRPRRTSCGATGTRASARSSRARSTSTSATWTTTT